jgi:hypothetical protein
MVTLFISASTFRVMFFYSADGGSKFFQNTGIYLIYLTPLHHIPEHCNFH